MNEAMNSGCAVVASAEAGSTPFLIQNQENGLTYQSGDIETLYRLVTRLLVEPELARRLGMNAYETIVNEWNAEVAAKRLVLLAEKLLAGSTYSFCSGPCSNASIVKDNWYTRGANKI